MQLIADKLKVTRGIRTVIRDLSFEVSAGSALILKGANGAGKTTLLRALAGFLPLEAGTITLQRDGARDGSALDGEVAEHCHYIGHTNGIRSAMTVSENARFWADYLADGPGNHTDFKDEMPEDLAQKSLATFNLQDLADIPAGYLSAGQQRRLGLTRLVAAPRSVWLMDEPTVSLDTASVALLSTVVDKHVASGGIVVVATHIPLGIEKAKELELKPLLRSIASADTAENEFAL